MSRFADRAFGLYLKNTAKLESDKIEEIINETKEKLKLNDKEAPAYLSQKYKINQAAISLFIPKRFLSEQDMAKREAFISIFKK